ncbi:MAG: hypothetical protein EB116_16930, partial [Betaproteobacteria bacterium]|nr:hypothetical protein [Betaproteobacteria bacterium]
RAIVVCVVPIKEWWFRPRHMLGRAVYSAPMSIRHGGLLGLAVFDIVSVGMASHGALQLQRDRSLRSQALRVACQTL